MYTPYFQRRPDLTFNIRCLISYLVVCQPRRGLVTELGCKYKTSRRFIYDLAEKFRGLENRACVTCVSPPLSDERKSLRFLLRLRMEGKCGLEGIHSLMVGEGYRYSSVGFISESLKRVGQMLSSDDVSGDVIGEKYVFCCDEIYAKGTAILMTVEPVSWNILRLELSHKCEGVSWEAHWNALKEQGYEPLYVVKDEGCALSSGHANAFGDQAYQSDTFHAVAHRLGVEAKKLEKAAYKAIGAEYKSLDLLEGSKSASCRAKRSENYLSAQKSSQQAVELFDHFTFLYHSLLDCFQVFDGQGELKDLNKTVADFETALELLKTLANGRFNEQIASIKACQNHLFHFVEIAQQKVAQLAQTLDKPILQKLCLAWQTQKNAIKVKRNAHRKHALERKEAYILAEIQQAFPDNFANNKLQAYSLLDQIVQASSAVEGVNSILRPYLNNAKNNITQEFLNLFRFYHNHRRFYAGKRKGKTPNEILTGQVQKLEWLDILEQKIAL